MPDLPDLIVPARFRGPPSSGNGGWSAGAIAVRAHQACPDAAPGSGHRDHTLPWPAVTVSLQAPPPLDVPLSVTASDDGGVTATYDGRPVLSARCSHDEITDVEPVHPDEARAAMPLFAGIASHPFPTCFSCGTGRAPGDGLRLQPGRVAGGDGAYAVAWRPGADVDLETVWAALDCPGGWASGIAGRPMVLGTMTAQVEALPAAGEDHVVMAWQRGGEGRNPSTRKYLSGTALFSSADGRLLAQAEATWIAIDPNAVRPAGGAS